MDHDDDASAATRPAGELVRPFTLTRRQLLAAGGGGVVALGLAGLAGYELHRAPARKPQKNAPPAIGPAAHTFVTRPDLFPPRVTITRYGTGSNLSPEYIFLSARTYIAGASGQPGLMVMDRAGRLVWFKPIFPAAPFDFNAQAYQGRPVLTWWQGNVVYDYGIGTGEMADASYGHVRPIQAGNGLRSDLHELQLTPQGTALLTAYEVVNADLSRYGGPAKGQLVTGHAQEVDLATGKVVYDWDSLGQIGLGESYQPAPQKGEWDYFHINSIAQMPDGDWLVSARNTWALYKVDRGTGRVVWRMNGKKSDFTMGPGARFYWQHDGRAHGSTTLTVFDDGSSPPEEHQSRGLLLSADMASMHVSLRRAYLHPAGFLAANQGNVQLLPDGRVFIGWGNQPYFSEFAADGSLLLDGELPIGYHSYRAYLHDWTGHPLEAPVAAARVNPAGGTIVYASWNGATEVATWVALAGTAKSSLHEVGSQAWQGFETAVAVNADGPYYAAAAVDRNGRELARSVPVKAQDGT
jgi:hypothetical protein